MKKNIFFCISFFWVGVLYSMTYTIGSYSYTVFKGVDFQKPHVTAFLSQWSSYHYSKYPYLYAEDVNYTKNICLYIAENCPEALCIIAYKNNKPIAYIQGIALPSLYELFPSAPEAFLKANLKIKDYFYVIDDFMLPGYEDQSLSKQLFVLFENNVKTLGYKCTCLVTESPKNNPLKPKGYKDPDYKYVGYTHSKIKAVFNAPTFQADGTIKDQDHTCEFWIKNL